MGKTVSDLWREATYKPTGLPIRFRAQAKEAKQANRAKNTKA